MTSRDRKWENDAIDIENDAENGVNHGMESGNDVTRYKQKVTKFEPECQKEERYTTSIFPTEKD